MKVWKIYKHTLKEGFEHSGWGYIGQTSQIAEKRWQNSKGYTKKNQEVFYNAIQKYGWNNFKHEIVEDNIESLEKANEREIYWISFYHTYIKDSNCHGYNMTPGGLAHNISYKVRIIKDNETKIVSTKVLSQYEEVGWRRMTKKEINKFYNEEHKATIKQQKHASYVKNLESIKNIRKLKYQQNRDLILQQAKVLYRQKSTRAIKKVPVLCKETNTVFSSITGANRYCGGNVGQCLRGVTKTAGGYHWAYAEENTNA